MLGRFNTSIPYPVGHISPITLDKYWDRSRRASFFLFAGCFGVFFSVLFISTFFVIRAYCRRGKCNGYMALLGFFDLVTVITTFFVAFATVVHGEEFVARCYYVEVTVAISTKAYSVLSMFSSIHDFNTISYLYTIDSLRRCQTTSLLTVILLMGIATSCYGTLSQNNYDFCTRSFTGSDKYQMYTFVMFHVIPFILTMYCHLKVDKELKRRARTHAPYRRSRRFNADLNAIRLNIFAYLFFVAGWLPYLIVTWLFPNALDEYFYMTAWIGVCRSLFTSFLYGLLNENYRMVYIDILKYLCCKVPIRAKMLRSQRRALEFTQRVEQTSSHILLQTVGNQRYASPRVGVETAV